MCCPAPGRPPHGGSPSTRSPLLLLSSSRPPVVCRIALLLCITARGALEIRRRELISADAPSSHGRSVLGQSGRFALLRPLPALVGCVAHRGRRSRPRTGGVQVPLDIFPHRNMMSCASCRNHVRCL